MSTFIRLLPLELQEVQEYKEPDMQVEKGDHIVGDMSDDLKKLYTLWRQFSYRASELTLQLEYGRQNVGKAEVNEIKTKAEVLRDLFWIAVSDEFELWDRNRTGVRKGFKVVWSEEQRPDMPPFLRQILGMDG